ncbi:hypothetical protein WJX72_003307 [[Myrmecia] bisecta]|uniref:F-box domain-containing protein n=1 Tax=[Myrmecia] bisecta TaxID=41462 RepID=A0AAW1R670_9CHLO
MSNKLPVSHLVCLIQAGRAFKERCAVVGVQRRGLSNMDGWEDLPVPIQLHILARVPLTTAKLAARFVSKAWAALLDDPAAHSRQLEPEDERKYEHESAINAAVVPLQYWKSLRALRCRRLQSWDDFPTNLLELELSFDEDSGDLAPLANIPYMPELIHLEIAVDLAEEARLQGGHLTLWGETQAF